MFDVIGERVKQNISMRLIFEFLASFVLIFMINIGISLGEAGVTGFKIIYNVNIVLALWIGTWIFLAYLFFEKTNISTTLLYLVVLSKKKVINNKEFVLSILFQFLGGLFAAFLIWEIIDVGMGKDIKVMGGTTTYIKGLFLLEGSKFKLWEPYNFETGWKYGFAIIQGIVSALFLITAFIGNGFVDRKFNREIFSKVSRYIILIVCISIPTILSANTTNWIRVLAPAIVSQISSWATKGNSTMLYTTLLYITFQSLGIIFIYYFYNYLNKIESIQEE